MRVKQYVNNPNASIYFYHKGLIKYVGVMLKGKMEVLTDQDTKNMIWKKGDTMFYKKGVTWRQKVSKKNSRKIIVIAILSFVIILTLIIGIAFIVLAIRTNKINDDYSAVIDSEKYQTTVFVDGVDVITQDVSCGYAVIEMFSAWNGGKVTEETLYEKYGKVVTSTGKSFCDEFNNQFPEFQTTMYQYLTNSELIDKVYDCLSDGIPVPFEWAAKYGDEWTLHYSLIVGMDLRNDKVTVANPYGYIETISLNEFVNRTSFNSFENMPLLYKFGFAFGIFEKNTVFIPTRVQ